MGMDDRSGKQIADVLDAVVDKKAHESVLSLFLFAVLAGAYIGFGAIAATTVIALGGKPVTGGEALLIRFLAGSVFCVGLILVVIPGSELFTGNVLMTVGVIDRRITPLRVLRNWGIVWVGNFVGAILLALCVYGSGLMNAGANPPLGETAGKIADMRIDFPFGDAFFRGILCNILVCLAVILALASRNVIGKIAGIYFPIMVFVLSGFEHSIANMYFLSAGLMAKGEFICRFGDMFHNLIPVTLGNIVGGMLVIVVHPAQLRRLGRKLRKR